MQKNEVDAIDLYKQSHDYTTKITLFPSNSFRPLPSPLGSSHGENVDFEAIQGLITPIP